MDILLKAVQALLNMGAVALLPIMICILGLVFRMKFGASLKAGLMVGIGFQGLSLTVGLLTATIEPITQYYQKMGSGFTAADIGFAAVGGASWTVPFAPIAVPLIVIANFILLRAGLTKVLNVDIWNYIHFLIPGALAYALWGNAVLGLAITVGLSIAALYAGQAIAHKWQGFFGLDGTTCSTLSFTTFMYPLSWVINKLIDHIPGVKDIDIDMKKLEEKLGFFGDPAFVGLIVGIFLGLLTRQAPTTIFGIGMGIASVYGGGMFNIFLLRQFIRTIPKELDEAAFVDGAGHWAVFTQIILPLSKPSLTCVGLFTFLNSWNDLINPLIYLNSDKKYTIQLGLRTFIGYFNAEWHLMMAAACAAIIPVVLVFLVGQKYFVEGIATTGLKG